MDLHGPGYAGAWESARCPYCRQRVYARRLDDSTPWVEHLYTRFAPHMDWLNRVCGPYTLRGRRYFGQ